MNLLCAVDAFASVFGYGIFRSVFAFINHFVSGTGRKLCIYFAWLRFVCICVCVLCVWLSVCLCARCVCGCIIPDSHCWDTSPNEVKQSDKWDYTTNRKYAIICYSSWVECVRDDAKWKMRFSFWYKWDWPTRLLLFACIDQTSFLSFSVSLCSSEQDKPSATWEHRIRSKDKPKIISESLDHF